MMDDTKFAPADPDRPAESPQEQEAPQGAGTSESPAGTDSPALAKFRSCRWRAAPDEGEFCTHRDVLPFAGKEGFSADSWCPECGFYKLRRTPKKRERVDYTY
jgi:hypothetical protein